MNVQELETIIAQTKDKLDAQYAYWNDTVGNVILHDFNALDASMSKLKIYAEQLQELVAEINSALPKDDLDGLLRTACDAITGEYR